MEEIFCPVSHQGRQIKEIELKVFDLITGQPGKQNVRVIETSEKRYEVNLGSIRYHVLKRNPECACCGIRITRCYLEHDVQNTSIRGTATYHIQFYAETGIPDRPSHLVLITRDHIVAKSKEGPDSIENSQTLCVNCNFVKGATDFTVEQIRSILFPSFRAYKSSFALNKAKEVLAPFRGKIFGNTKKIKAITAALEIVHDDRAPELRKKIADCEAENVELIKKCNEIELRAQIEGVWPSEV